MENESQNGMAIGIHKAATDHRRNTIAATEIKIREGKKKCIGPDISLSHNRFVRLALDQNT